jgi:hypothetical protein
MEHLSIDRYIIISRYGDSKISFILTRDCNIECTRDRNLAPLIAENNFNIREATELLSQAKRRTVFPVLNPGYYVSHEFTFEEFDFQIVPVEISVSFFL